MQSYESITLLSILLTHTLVCRKSSTENHSTNPTLQEDHLKCLTVASYLDLISFSLFVLLQAKKSTATQYKHILCQIFSLVVVLVRSSLVHQLIKSKKK